MSRARFFIDDELIVGEKRKLPKDVSHHMMTVLRKRVSDQVVLFNGRGGEYVASIIAANKRDIEVELLSHNPIERESSISVTLAQGIGKGQRMDLVIQKAVELGVHYIVPLKNQRSNVSLKGDRLTSRMQHWRQVVMSACEQCGRNTLPQVSSPLTVEEWISGDDNPAKLILVPGTNKGISEVISNPNQISLLIGSEGGLTEEEIQQAMNSGYECISMGTRILRTETAALAALSACQTLWGDLK